MVQYMAELRRLAKTCQFANFLEDALRDQFVCGMIATNVQKRLLSEEGLNIDRALKLALSMEAAELSTKEIHGTTKGSGSMEVRDDTKNDTEAVVLHLVKKTIPSSQIRLAECIRCAKGGHIARNCPFKTTQCCMYGKIGHLARACLSVDRFSAAKENRQKTHLLSEKTDYEGDDVMVLEHIGTLDSRGKRIWIKVLVYGTHLKMELDTGAGLSLVNEHMWRDQLHSP